MGNQERISTIAVSAKLNLIVAAIENLSGKEDLKYDKICVWDTKSNEVVKKLIDCKVIDCENLSICEDKKFL